MDLLGMIMQGEGGKLVEKLTGSAGFSADQAQKFAPAAGAAVVDALKANAGKLDLGNLTSATNVGTLMGLINVGGLASKAGVGADMGKKGLQTILPMILGLVASKGGGAEGLLKLLGGGGLGGAMGKLGGMLGR